ncbi:hypothetical protein [Acetobacter senegalensis]|uniref:hypothetical protein n=1 Tax=Acetobacter senegalensis TaxID=446692 RepID=UPI00264B94D5|nr:hypothetical protein [Acetobacter senegalensis]MDN7350105.1 hypothetical protein [Acetobacter senegalensis]
MSDKSLSCSSLSVTAQVQAAYPARYYAGYDATATQPAPVTAWYDTWSMSSVESLPPASQLLPISAADWANTTSFRLPAGKAVQNGAIVDYTAPLPPLATQAANALQQAATTSWAAYGMYGETPPAVWQTYLASLRALASGADTTSTQLPAQPALSAAAMPTLEVSVGVVEKTHFEENAASRLEQAPEPQPAQQIPTTAGQGA